MKFLDTDISPLGMGCWPIGGAMFFGDEPLGYTNVDDDESIRAIHAALDSGVTLFDTAPAYGAGHAEQILARALKDRPKAEALFDEVEKACAAGKVCSYGWSTDFSQSAGAFADRPAFIVVEHAMNVLLDAPRMRKTLVGNDLVGLIRSPLAMGLLGGNYGIGDAMRKNEIRATANPRTDYFANGQVYPAQFTKLDPIRELLTTGGRTLAQGALGWLWAQDGPNIPIPGALANSLKPDFRCSCGR